MNFIQKQPAGKPASRTLQKSTLAVLGAIAMLITGTGAIAQNTENKKTFQKSYMLDAIYNYSARSIELTANTGCMSSTLRHLGNNIRFEVDEGRALITGTGWFTYKASKLGIGSADCNGAAKQIITVPNVDARRYSVLINGKYRGVLDFTRSSKPARLTDLWAATRKSDFLTRMQLTNTYASVNLDNWASRNAASVMDLFRPITKGHPESLEGRPEMEVSMSGGPNAITVKITNYGYLDDSVAGGRYYGVVTRKGSNWYLDSLWQQNLCARGKNAGQWIKGPCL